MNSTSKSKEEVVMNLLQERHLNYLGWPMEKAKENPFWQNIEPLSKIQYSEWVEYGVNSLMSITGCNRTEAEVEMSWIEAKYGLKVQG